MPYSYGQSGLRFSSSATFYDFLNTSRILIFSEKENCIRIQAPSVNLDTTFNISAHSDVELDLGPLFEPLNLSERDAVFQHNLHYTISANWPITAYKFSSDSGAMFDIQLLAAERIIPDQKAGIAFTLLNQQFYYFPSAQPIGGSCQVFAIEDDTKVSVSAKSDLYNIAETQKVMQAGGDTVFLDAGESFQFTYLDYYLANDNYEWYSDPRIETFKSELS